MQAASTGLSEPKTGNPKIAMIIIAYPFAILTASLIVNLVLGVSPMTVALPTEPVVTALIIAAALLVLNHGWLMTTTELTRLQHGLHATPEEWAQSGTRRENASPLGLQELERRHAAHRNATENTVLFALLAAIFSITSPSALIGYMWLVGFAVARLGHTYSFIQGRDGLRGIFMSASLVAMFGLLSHLAISALI